MIFKCASIVLTGLIFCSDVLAYRVEFRSVENGKPRYSGECNNGKRFAGGRDDVYSSMPYTASGPAGSFSAASEHEAIAKACGE